MDPGPPAEASEKPGRSLEGEIQSAPGLTIDRIVLARRAGAHSQNGYFYLLQMDDSFTESVCFDTAKEGKGER
jgi:hypothetical protein